MRLVLLFLCVIATMLASGPTAAQQYQYDNAGRLTAALYANGASIRYQYDAASNITRVQYIAAPVALPPEGVIDTPDDDITIDAGQSVNFTGTGTDPDGATPLTFLWDFDGAAPDSNDEDPGDVTFASAGTYTVEFTVTDATNLADPSPDTVVVTVNPVPPNGVIDTPTGNVSIQAGQSVNFTATGTDPDGATPLSYAWDFNGGATNSTAEDPGNTPFATAGTYTVTLTVTDADGLADPTPDSVVVTVTAAPTGGSGGGSSQGGGGSMFLLPLLGAVWLLLRKSRSALVLLLLVLAGAANAQTWFNEASGTDQNLNDVWMSSLTLAYAVGDSGTVLQYDGATWTTVDVGTTVQLNSVWGTSANDVWVVGASGTVLHYDGTSWTPVDIGAGTLPLNDVWTRGAGETIYIVGARGVWYNSGAGWAKQGIKESNISVTLDPNQNFTSIRGSDNYLVLTSNGSYGTNPGLFVNFDWVGLSTFVLEDVWVYDDSFMLAVGAGTRLMDGGDPTNGSTANWQNYSVDLPPRGVWGADPQNIWAVGGTATYGRINYFDGNASNTWTVEVTESYRRFNGIDGVDAGNVLVVGNLGTIYRLSTPEAGPTAANHPYSGTAEGNVNAYTGELVYETVDFSIGSDPLEFRRYYTSNLWDQGTVGERLGDNWTHNYEWRLDTNYEGISDRVRITNYRGTEFVFDVGATSNTRVSPTWANVSLVVDNGIYILVDHDDEQMYAIDSSGLLWIEDRNGNRHTMIYNQGYLASVNNGKENQIAFEYTPGGKLARAYVPEGGEELAVAFTYSGTELTEATATSGYHESYTYDTGALMTSMAIGGTTPVRWTYNADNRVASMSYTEGGTFNYAYTDSNLVVTEPGNSTRSYSHNSKGQLDSFVDGEGAVTGYGYDSAGRRVSMTDPVGRYTSWTFDPVTGKLASVTQPGGFLTTYEYAAGSSDYGIVFWNLTKIVDPDEQADVLERDANGNLVKFTDKESAVWEFTYDGNGRLLELLNPLGGRTVYTRTVDGSIQTVTDPQGNVTEYWYDLFQRLERVYYADTTESSFEYSTRFEPDRAVLKSGATVNYTYDSGDRVVRVDYSDGSYEIFGFDTAGSLVRRERPGNLITTYEYDERRNRNRVVYPGNVSESYIYDSANRLIRRIDANDEAWNFEYFGDGSLKATVDPEGERVDFAYDNDPRALVTAITRGLETSRMVYDNLGHLNNRTDPQERVLQATRDKRGSLLGTMLQPAGISRLYDRNAMGQLERYTNPLGGVWITGYNEDGQIRSRTNSLAETTTIARDALNRPEEVAHPDGETTSMSYGPSGAVNNITGSDGTVVNIDVTPEGRLMGGTDLLLGYSPVDYRLDNSNGIRIQYNDQDRPWRITVADGKVIEYEYNWRGDVVAVRDWLGGTTTITPTKYGKRDDITYANGLAVDYVYDDRRRLTGIQFGLAGASSAPLGSITLHRAPTTGRVESADRVLPGPQNIPSLNKVFAFNVMSRVNGFSYDARGNLVDDGENTYEYDTLNRLTSMTTPVATTRISYDALGKIVRREEGAKTRQYLSNYALRKPRITVEQDAAGNDLWYYVHTLEGKLLYRISGDGIRHFYHFDEDGNTVFLTDNDGNVIQTYFYSPLGDLIDESGDVENSHKKGAEDSDKQGSGANPPDSDSPVAAEITVGDKGRASNSRSAQDLQSYGWNNMAPEEQDLFVDFGVNALGFVLPINEKLHAPKLNARVMAKFGVSPQAFAKLPVHLQNSLSSTLGNVMVGVSSGIAGYHEWNSDMYTNDVGRFVGTTLATAQNATGVVFGPLQLVVSAADVVSYEAVGDKTGINDVLFGNLSRTVAAGWGAAWGYASTGDSREAWRAIQKRVDHTKNNEGLAGKLLNAYAETGVEIVYQAITWDWLKGRIQRARINWDREQEELADFYNTP